MPTYLQFRVTHKNLFIHRWPTEGGHLLTCSDPSRSDQFRFMGWASSLDLKEYVRLLSVYVTMCHTYLSYDCSLPPPPPPPKHSIKWYKTNTSSTSGEECPRLNDNNFFHPSYQPLAPRFHPNYVQCLGAIFSMFNMWHVFFQPNHAFRIHTRVWVKIMYPQKLGGWW